MKRSGFLLEKVYSFNNLLNAAHKAMRGKKDKSDVAEFFLNMENELMSIKDAIYQGMYHPEQYDCFYIHEPKQRYICSADFRDRVVHHALCNILEPIFERSFIFDSYACRQGKGAHKAIKRLQFFCRKAGYFLKADIKKFFESIDHEILKQMLRKKMKDKGFLTLLYTIIDHPIPRYPAGKGIAIGNLTSQWWANFYLNAFDHFIKDARGIRFYIRYMDDFVLLSNDKAFLQELLGEIRKYLSQFLSLQLKEKACFIAPVTQGIPFLGFRVFPNCIRLKHDNLVRFSRKVREKERLYLSGDIEERELIHSVTSMVGHLKHANTLRMRQHYFWRGFLG